MLYIKPIARVYTRECHENKNTRFWATYGCTWMQKQADERRENYQKNFTFSSVSVIIRYGYFK